MTEQAPTTAEWQRLYAAMADVKALAPWKWMQESDIFGVQNSETGDLGFVSVMGTLGEHLSIAVYLGPEGLNNFWWMNEGVLQSAPELMFETPQLQASFEDRKQLTDKDRKQIKSLGLKFRGRQSWPLFRSYRPGFFPWYLEAAEVRFLTAALEQTVIIGQRVRQDETLLEPLDEESYLIRVPTKKGNEIIWEDSIQRVPEPQPKSLQIPMDAGMLAHVKQLPQSGQKIDVGFIWTPMQIQEERGERPYFSYNLLFVDHRSGFILGTQLCTPNPTYEEMLARIPQELVTLLAGSPKRPREFFIYPSTAAPLIALIARELNIRVKEAEYMPMLEEARESLLSFLG